MPFTTNKSTALEFVEEVLNKGNLEKMKNLITPDFVWHGQFKEVRGLKSFNEWLSLERSTFPDLQFNIVDDVVEHDKVAIRWILQATHKKEVLGFPASHKKFQTTGINIFHFEGDKIKEVWIAFDALNTALQLGVVDVVHRSIEKKGHASPFNKRRGKQKNVI
ncbi:MAG TPA: ester cyclase [Nitrososphaeraceae archaeon]|nr:ester cyclase [Nitrososphaeraceae archaeon]HET7390711.1 ester cyclase [Nitrososphaeraceae archaeon]